MYEWLNALQKEFMKNPKKFSFKKLLPIEFLINNPEIVERTELEREEKDKILEALSQFKEVMTKVREQEGAANYNFYEKGKACETCGSTKNLRIQWWCKECWCENCWKAEEDPK